MIENVYIVRDIVNLSGGKIIGRKKVQKIIYIIQQIANPFEKPYEFRWNYYGVYSDELAGELSLGQFFGILRESYREEYQGYRTYIIEAVDSANPSGIGESDQMAGLIAYLANQETRLLEVLSSIMYFKNKGITGQELQKNLHDFKGHLAPFFNEAFDALSYLEQTVQKSS